MLCISSFDSDQLQMNLRERKELWKGRQSAGYLQFRWVLQCVHKAFRFMRQKKLGLQLQRTSSQKILLKTRVWMKATRKLTRKPTQKPTRKLTRNLIQKPTRKPMRQPAYRKRIRWKRVIQRPHRRKRLLTRMDSGLENQKQLNLQQMVLVDGNLRKWMEQKREMRR